MGTEPHVEPPPHAPEPAQDVVSYTGAPTGMPNGGDANANMDSLYMQFGLTKPAENVPVQRGHANQVHANQVHANQVHANQGGASTERVMITRDSLRSAMHELVDDDAFMNVIMNKLKTPNMQ